MSFYCSKFRAWEERLPLKSERMKHTWTQRHLWICFIGEVLNKICRGKSRVRQSSYLISLFLTHPGMYMCKHYIFWIGLSFLFSWSLLDSGSFWRANTLALFFSQLIVFMCVMVFNTWISLKFGGKKIPKGDILCLSTCPHLHIYYIYTLFQ